MSTKENPALAPLARALGTWAVTGSHPYLPGRTLRGSATFERAEDGAFVRMRTTMEDAEIPDGVAFFGTDDVDDACTMLYFDVRGVARKYDVVFDADGFTWSRDAPDFAQRFSVRFSQDGRSMEAEGKMKKDGGAWEPDIRLSYAR